MRSTQTEANAGANGDAAADENRGSAEARKKQIETFFDLLIERFLDLNSYVRSKLITVCGRLLDLPTKFPSSVPRSPKWSSDISKTRVAVCARMPSRFSPSSILTHPFGMLHGGELCLQEWQARYDLVSKELEETEGSLNLPGENVVDHESESEAGDEDDDDEDEMDENDEDDERMETTLSCRTRMTTRRCCASSWSQVFKEAKDSEAEEQAKESAPLRVDLQALAAAQAEMEPVDAEKVMRLRLTKR